MGKIENLHTTIYNLVNEITDFNQGFYERPYEITDEKLPAFAVYFNGHDNQVSSMRTNKRTYNFVVEVIYDNDDKTVSQTVVSDLVSLVIDKLEDIDNIKLANYASYTLPTTSQRIEDYQIAGKHYIAYAINLPVVSNESL